MCRILAISTFIILAMNVANGRTVFVSPDKQQRVEYEVLRSDPQGVNGTHIAKLFRGDKAVWSFSAKGRGIEFAWSPTSRDLLFGVTLTGRDMALYYLDTTAKYPKEQDLNLESVESQVERSLPELASLFGSRSRIDFEKIVWLPQRRCQLHYVLRDNFKAGGAELSTNFQAKPVKLKIDKIIPLAED